MQICEYGKFSQKTKLKTYPNFELWLFLIDAIAVNSTPSK